MHYQYNVYDLHRYGFSRGSYRGACYDTNIGIAHQLGSVHGKMVSRSPCIAGDLWSDNEMAIVAMGLLTTGR